MVRSDPLMIELSSNKKELKNKIYDAFEGYHRDCRIEALEEIIKESFEAMIEIFRDEFTLVERIRYHPKVEGETINCHYAYSVDDAHILRGEELIEKHGEKYHATVWIKIKVDSDGGNIRLMKVSLDLYNDVYNLTGLESDRSVKGNMIEGLSYYVDCEDTELQNIVDSLWEYMQEHISNRD